MTASTTVSTTDTRTSTSTPPARRPRLIGAVFGGGIVCALLLGGWSLLQEDRGPGAALSQTTTTLTTTEVDRATDPVFYILGSEADRPVLQAFLAQINVDRLRRGLVALEDDVVVPSTSAEVQQAEARREALTLWQAGTGRSLWIADLR